MAQAEKLYTLARHKKDDAQTNLQRLESELRAALSRYAAFKENLIPRLTPFGITKILDNNLDAIAAALNSRLKKWQTRQKQKNEIEKSAGELASVIKNLEAITQTLNDSMQEKLTLFKTHEQELNELKTERYNLYDSKNPNDAELRLEKLLVAAEKSVTKTRDNRDQIKGELNDLKTRISTLKENLAQIKPALNKLEPIFIANCKKTGFEDEQQFLSCRLSNDEKNSLSQQERKLNDKQADIETRKKDRERRLANEINKEMTKLAMDELKNEQSVMHEALKNLGEEIGAQKQKLIDNSNAKSKHRQQRSLIETQKKESARWNSLHSLIGSADGKKFRNFAQGLTFELMVSHANLQLKKMTDRYLLIRDQKQPLELNVIDNYQASEIRSTKNLSGGESFIVSLSLALGLSKMASQNVRVDSLFLDEGFGSLDEDALETALEALSTLQEDDKLIGIISHVAALKERIGTQITVQPVPGGKSIIRGPGCKRLTDRNLSL